LAVMCVQQLTNNTVSMFKCILTIEPRGPCLLCMYTNAYSFSTLCIRWAASSVRLAAWVAALVPIGRLILSWVGLRWGAKLTRRRPRIWRGTCGRHEHQPTPETMWSHVALYRDHYMWYRKDPETTPSVQVCGFLLEAFIASFSTESGCSASGVGVPFFVHAFFFFFFKYSPYSSSPCRNSSG
jgi:hypothetical protein